MTRAVAYFALYGMSRGKILLYIAISELSW